MVIPEKNIEGPIFKTDVEAEVSGCPHILEVFPVVTQGPCQPRWAVLCDLEEGQKDQSVGLLVLLLSRRA